MQHFAVLVINLDHSTGRLDSMRQQLGGLGLSWQRVPAIHGEQLTDDQRALFDAEGYRRKHGKTVNWRELGCYLSHLASHEGAAGLAVRAWCGAGRRCGGRAGLCGRCRCPGP
jgi:GR25 family glycosyltransferase involved in LPS biosynthesis